MQVYVVYEYDSEEDAITIKCVKKSFESAREVVENTYKEWCEDMKDCITDDYSYNELLPDYAYAKVGDDYWYLSIETALMEVED